MTSENVEFNKENVEQIETLQQKMNNHFQEELAIKKQIIDFEKKIEEIKLANTENYIKLAKDKTQTKLASQINKSEDEKDKLSNEVGQKYISLSNLMSQRKALLKEMNLFNKKEITMKILNDYYGYYVTLIENLNLSQREYLSKNQISIQQVQIEELVNQVKFRDAALKKLNDEFRKKNVVYKPEGVREYREFSREPLKLPQISNYPYSQTSPLVNKEEITESKNVGPRQSGKPTINKKGSRPVRSFKYELSTKVQDSRINHPLRLNPNKYSMNLSEKIAAPNIMNRSNRSNHSRDKSNYFNEDVLNASGTNISVMRDSKPSIANSWGGRDIFQREQEKLVKTLTRKNIIGRFRGSPYLNAMHNKP